MSILSLFLTPQIVAGPVYSALCKIAEAWKIIPITRNKFAHDYPDDWNRKAALINVACESAAEMHGILTRIEKKLKTKHPGFTLDKSVYRVPQQ